MFPDNVASVAAVCGSATTREYNKVFLDSVTYALKADVSCLDKEQKYFIKLPAAGLAAVGHVYAGYEEK